MNKYDEFKNRKIDFESVKRKNIQMELEYVISQIDTLFDIISRENKIEHHQEENNEITSEEKNNDDEVLGFDMEIIEDPIPDEVNEKSLQEILEEELLSWGLSLECAGCKYLIKLVNSINEINVGMLKSASYDSICRFIDDDAGSVKRSLTGIRKKADFSNPKYFSILSRMKDSVTNMVILQQVIDLFEVDS